MVDGCMGCRAEDRGLDDNDGMTREMIKYAGGGDFEDPDDDAIASSHHNGGQLPSTPKVNSGGGGGGAITMSPIFSGDAEGNI